MVSNENILGVRDVEPGDGNETTKKSKDLNKKSTPLKRKRQAEPLTPEEEERKRKEKEEKALKKAELRYKMVFGIDFGTTYSGIAYGSTLRTWNDVEVVTDWGSGQNDVLEKAPTRIAYQLENPSLSSDVWGYEASSGLTICQWFKLLLDSGTEISDLDDPLLQRCTGSGLLHIPDGMTAQEVATDFLRKLYERALESLKEEIAATALEKTPMRFVITLPATWSHAARQATRKAAQDAGFGSRENDDIVLIDEPEAAAVYAIKSTAATFGVSPFQEKTCVTIVDLGGGTIDLCTYRIIKKDPLQIEEACVGQGVKAGATSIDRNLHEMMKKRFGIAFDELPPGRTGPGSAFMEAFEVAKRSFKGNADKGKVYYLDLKMPKVDRDDPVVVASYDFNDDTVKLTGEEMEAFFETVLQKTFQLLEKQVRRTQKAKNPAIKTVILCGGLGSSPYVRARLQEYVEQHLPGEVELVKPKRSWSAIIRGAVISHIGKSPVTFRRCRDHIGFCVHEKFDKNRHKDSDLYNCPHLGPRAKNQMRWHVRRGEKISANLRRKIECYAVIKGTDVAKDEYVCYQDLYTCGRKKAPERADARGVRKIGSIKINLTKLVQAERKRCRKEHLVCPSEMTFNVDLVATLGADKGVLLISAKDKKRNYGDIVLEYETNPAYKGVLVTDDD